MAKQSGFLVKKDGGEHLPTMTDGKLDTHLLGAAHAALTTGFRGNKYEGPDKGAALAKLKKLYAKAGLDWPAEGTTRFYFNGAVTAADGHVTGKPSLMDHVYKMQSAVQDAVKDDARFRTGKNSEGVTYTPTPAGSYDYNRPNVASILVPDDDGKHEAVVRRDDGKLVKHGFDYDAESGEATMHDGDSEETDCTPVYTRLLAEHDEMVKAASESQVASK